MIPTLEAIRWWFGRPVVSEMPGHYCGGGALCVASDVIPNMRYWDLTAFPIWGAPIEDALSALGSKNPSGYGTIIIFRNDDGDFEGAWAAAAEALGESQ